MKKVVAILFVALLGWVIFTGIYGIDGFPSYGKANLNERVSSAYITKSVTTENTSVAYGMSSGLETGSANYVTSIIVNYRSFDTLGEVTVLFVSALGISLLFGSVSGKMRNRFPSSSILKPGSKVVFPLILVTGVYIFTHGHLSPGGGFPGGSMIASAVLLMYLADENFRIKIERFKRTESLAGSLYVIIGLLGLVMTNYFLGNFVDTGKVGTLLSAGIIPIIYVLVGLKVGSELSGIITDFLKEEVVEK